MFKCVANEEVMREKAEDIRTAGPMTVYCYGKGQCGEESGAVRMIFPGQSYIFTKYLQERL